MQPDGLLAAWMIGSAAIYALTGGADYGGGVWDLFARGPRRTEQRRLIEDAIAPVWETNHVWLIAIVVALFSAFPLASAVIATALHIPLTALLLGIVARGASFVFRAYDERADRVQARWGLVFSISSIVTPVILGVIAGSLGTGEIEVDATNVVTSGFFVPWAMSLFPWVVGAFALALFAYLAAVYLTVESERRQDGALAGDFRRRAIGAWIVANAVALCTAIVASFEAPALARGLTHQSWSIALFGATAVCAIAALAFLIRRSYRFARMAAAAHVALVVGGWGAAQHPYLVIDDVSIERAAAPDNVLWAIVIALGLGIGPLAALLYWLFRVFKGQR
jgi:cytochrome d ubiquinol oxidase subunit II